MKTTRKHTVEAREIDVHEYTCDLCGAALPVEHEDTTSEVVIRSEVTTHFPYTPDMGRAETIEVDCCADCFAAKAVPALEALGFKPRREEREW